MKYICQAILCLILSALVANGQNIEATTKDGRDVVLKKNGTWAFKSAPQAAEKKPAPAAPKNPFITGEEYTLFSTTKEDTYGYSIYCQIWLIKKDILDNMSSWLKYVPKNPAAFAKKYKLPAKTSYFLQFTTANCEGRRLTSETAIFYNAEGDPLPSAQSFLFRYYGEPVAPRTVNEQVLEKLCVPPYIRAPRSE